MLGLKFSSLGTDQMKNISRCQVSNLVTHTKIINLNNFQHYENANL